ncbi:MAG: class I SAM-dependent methyltransferase [Phycisphaeraceae bacterium]
MKMQEATTSRCYDLWSSIYDHTFGALVHKRQIRAVEELRPQPGDRILDLGVGTGMTLPHYPDNVTIVGMDLSAGMLKKAADKIEEEGLDHCRLIQGDAMFPPFAEQSFDQIMITHVISVVSDPQRLLRWARRLLKPGGRIVMLNHFQSTNPVFGFFEKIANPLCVKIGWRSDLALADCLEGVDLLVSYRFKLSLVDLWQIVVLTEHEPGVTRGEEPQQIPRLAVGGR